LNIIKDINQKEIRTMTHLKKKTLYKVTLSRICTQHAPVSITAYTKEEAQELANSFLNEYHDDFENWEIIETFKVDMIVSIEPDEI